MYCRCMTASAAAQKWGVSVCTVDGYRFDLGDAKECFSMQDASKIITYLMTVSQLGQDTVHRYQGKEPSGRRRNEIVLDHHGQIHCSHASSTIDLIICTVNPRQASQSTDECWGHYVGRPHPTAAPPRKARRCRRQVRRSLPICKSNSLNTWKLLVCRNTILE